MSDPGGRIESADIEHAKRALMGVALGRRPRRTRMMHRTATQEQNRSFRVLRENLLGVGVSKNEPGADTLNVLVRKEIGKEVVYSYLDRFGMQNFPVEITVAGSTRAAAQGGQSVGHYTGPTGTISCAVQNENGERFLLGSSHVMAASNRGKIGVDPIWHPGPRDGGTASHRIGILSDFTKIAFGCQIANRFDAALCRPDTLAHATPGLLHLGEVASATAAFPQTKVRKVGRESGLTAGHIIITNLTTIIRYPNGLDALFDGMFAAVGDKGDFAKTGDSGALIVDEKNRAIGLLVGVSDNGLSFGTELGPTLDHLGVELM